MATAANLDASVNPLDAFRKETRAWLEAHFPPSLKGRENPIATIEGPTALSADEAAWKKAFGEKGWGVPTWPAQYGGGGLDRAEGRVLGEEMARLGAWNPIGGMGVMMFGPTLLEYGNEAQKNEHIPAIAKGEVRWDRIWRACRCSPRIGGITIWSTARRPGPRAGNGPTNASRWFGPINRKSMKGSAFC